jgi:hypothetical protein
MNGAIPPLPQYVFMAWCSVEAQGQLYLYLYQCQSLINQYIPYNKHIIFDAAGNVEFSLLKYVYPLL